MKKNKMMRLASGLLVAVLLTSSIVSGTFAKYTTSATSTDSARVAKWGVTITTQGEAFSKTYDDELGDDFAQTVISATEKVFAPGTTKTMTDLKVNGTPEVALIIEYDATVSIEGFKQTADWDQNPGTTNTTEEYCPIVFIVEGKRYAVTGINGNDAIDVVCNDVDDLITKVSSAIEGCAKKYPANQAINTETDAPTVGWEWKFEGNDDKKDTCLGNLADSGTAPTVTITVATTATQLD